MLYFKGTIIQLKNEIRSNSLSNSVTHQTSINLKVIHLEKNTFPKNIRNEKGFVQILSEFPFFLSYTFDTNIKHKLFQISFHFIIINFYNRN